MRNYLKKSTYFFTVFFISLLIVLFYHLFFNTNKPAASDHSTLTLTPFTNSEQKDLIMAQEQEAASIDSGPLVASMTPEDAQTRVLNPNNAAKPN